MERGVDLAGRRRRLPFAVDRRKAPRVEYAIRSAVDDLEAMRIARDITEKIQESLEYPGQIKVMVIRETRAIEYAR